MNKGLRILHFVFFLLFSLNSAFCVLFPQSIPALGLVFRSLLVYFDLVTRSFQSFEVHQLENAVREISAYYVTRPEE